MEKLIPVVILIFVVISVILSVVLLTFYNLNEESKNQTALGNEKIIKADRLGFVWSNSDPNNDLNFKWIRPLTAPFRRDYLEPTEGNYNFSLTDEFVERAQEGNVIVLPSIFPYPAWEQPSQILENKEEGKNEKFLSLDDFSLWAPPVYKCVPKDMDSYKRFVKALVERYDGDGRDDMPGLTMPIKYWEVVNEPYNNFPDQLNITAGNIEEIMHTEEYFFGSGKSYASLLKATYLAVKEADPDALVLNGGMEPPPKENIQGINYFNNYYGFYDEVINSAADYFDIFNFHYLEGSNENTDVNNPVMDLENFENRYSDKIRDKPVWITEFSVSNPGKLIIAVIKSMEKIDKIFLVGYIQQEWLPQNANSISLRNSQGNLTSLYYPVKTLGLLAGNAKNINKINENAYVFAYDDYRVFALWDNADLPDNVSGSIILIDYEGNARMASADEYKPSVNVSYVVTGTGLEDFLSRFENSLQVNETIAVSISSENRGSASDYNSKDFDKEKETEKDKEKNESQSYEKETVTNKGICGDNYCTIEEANSNSCPQDCTGRSCGDGICDEMENEELCPQDCAA